jgi:hypothetical protein
MPPEKMHRNQRRVDCELDHPLTFVNSTVEICSNSLLVAREWSAKLVARQMVPSADSVGELAERLDWSILQRTVWRSIFGLV